MEKFLEWFGLTGIPFTKDIDTPRLYVYSQISELHQKLALTIATASGLLVTGQAGTGKTTALRVYLEDLPSNRYRVVYLGHDQKGPSLFARLAAELGIRLNHGGNRMLQLTEHIRRHIKGSNKELILVVDEAHLLDWRTLEDIRLLTNSEMDRRSGLTLILLGQLWLRSKLKGMGSEALNQRMHFRYGLEGLTMKQSREYVRHHLALVGCSKEIFTDGAYAQLFHASGGILREINNICMEAMLEASNRSLEKIDEKLMKLVIDQRESS
jgi:general secretion pathway protein A